MTAEGVTMAAGELGLTLIGRATLGQATVLPPWMTIAVAAVVMLFIAAHLLSLQNADMPASRRRIRTANDFLLLIVTPLIAYGVNAPHLQNPRAFALGWLGVMALLVMIVLLALLDILNNVRLHAVQRSELGGQLGVADRRIAQPEPRGAGAAGGRVGEGGDER